MKVSIKHRLENLGDLGSAIKGENRIQAGGKIGGAERLERELIEEETSRNKSFPNSAPYGNAA